MHVLCLQSDWFCRLTWQRVDIYVRRVYKCPEVTLCAWLNIKIQLLLLQLMCSSIPSPPPQLVLSSSSFPPLFPSFLSLASSAVCLPDCLELNWNIVDNLTKHCFLNPVVLIPCSQRCCSRLSQPSWKTNIACHNTVYCVGHGRRVGHVRLSRTCFSPFPTRKSRSQVF